MADNVFSEPARSARLEAIAVVRAALHDEPVPAGADPAMLGLLCDVLRIFAEPEQVLDGFVIGLAMQSGTTTTEPVNRPADHR